MPQAHTDPTAFLLKRVERYSNSKFTAGFRREPGDTPQRDDEIGLVGECADYDAYVALPRVLYYEGQRYALTGWNSDTQEAYWKTSGLIAFLSDVEAERDLALARAW